MSDFYIYAASTYGITKYPKNNSGDFIFELPSKLFLQDSWTLGVLDVQLHKRGGTTSNVYLCCDGLVESYVDGLSVQILKPLNISKGQNNIEFSNIQYVRLKPCISVTQMRITIKDVDSLDAAPFLQGPTRCTLHFKQQS